MVAERLGDPPQTSLLPAREQVMVTREPLPKGVSHSMAFTVGSSPPSARRLRAGQSAGRSS